MKNDLKKSIRAIRWKDLVELSPYQRFVELSISLPWLTVSLLLAYRGYYFLALPFSFVFFLTGLRQVHNGFHYSLGISRKKTNLLLWLNSIIMLASMHAVKHNHLQHHKHCMDDRDVEGKCAKMPAWKALLYGPVFPLEQHYTALRKGNKSIKTWVWIELASITLFAAVVLAFDLRVLKYHLLAMLVGECCTAFFAIWTVHHDCDEEVQSRSIRSGWKSLITFDMFYHLEHHLFPKVPTINLPVLAKRLDEKLPDLNIKKVI